MTTAPPTCAAKDLWTDQWLPFQRSARDLPPLAVNAHTLVADDAPAATTSSPFWLGNETRTQDGPLRFHAVGRAIPLKAHPPVRPTATIAVKSPRAPLGTRLTMRQDALAGVTAVAVAAKVTASAAPVTASAVPTAAPPPVWLHRRCRSAAGLWSSFPPAFRPAVLPVLCPPPVPSGTPRP